VLSSSRRANSLKLLTPLDQIDFFYVQTVEVVPLLREAMWAFLPQKFSTTGHADTSKFLNTNGLLDP